MLKYILGVLAKELVDALVKALTDYFALRQKKKEDKEKVEDALKKKDPVDRANAVRDLLS